MTCFIFEKWTESLLRNLMALEQCHYPHIPHICDYVFLMDSLINSTKDEDLLIRNGIIVNYLGNSEELAILINKLSKDIVNGFPSSLCLCDAGLCFINLFAFL